MYIRPNKAYCLSHREQLENSNTMSAELQIGLPDVIVSTLKRPSECLESDETPSKKHHGAEQSSPSNSQPVSTSAKPDF